MQWALSHPKDALFYFDVPKVKKTKVKFQTCVWYQINNNVDHYVGIYIKVFTPSGKYLFPFANYEGIGWGANPLPNSTLLDFLTQKYHPQCIGVSITYTSTNKTYWYDSELFAANWYSDCKYQYQYPIVDAGVASGNAIYYDSIVNHCVSTDYNGKAWGVGTYGPYFYITTVGKNYNDWRGVFDQLIRKTLEKCATETQTFYEEFLPLAETEFKESKYKEQYDVNAQQMYPALPDWKRVQYGDMFFEIPKYFIMDKDRTDYLWKMYPDLQMEYIILRFYPNTNITLPNQSLLSYVSFLLGKLYFYSCYLSASMLGQSKMKMPRWDNSNAGMNAFHVWVNSIRRNEDKILLLQNARLWDYEYKSIPAGVRPSYMYPADYVAANPQALPKKPSYQEP